MTSGGCGDVDVSVLIPVYNELSHIRETAARMRRQQFDGSFELLFIDGFSEDGTRAVLEELAGEDPQVRLLDNPARHIPCALNVGLAHARGEFVARMDAHTYYPDNYLQRGVERLRRGDVAWVSGAALPYGVGGWSKRAELALGTWLGVGGASFRRGADREFDSDTGFTGVLRRATLESHGGWDEESLVNEDAELAARVRQAGGRIVCIPELAARYVPRDSLKDLAHQYWRYGQFRARTSRLHPESMRRSNLLPPVLFLTVIGRAFAPGRLRRPLGAGVALYGLSVAGVSIRSAKDASWRDGALLPLVFLTMHLAWGGGFLVGCVRFGPPFSAIAKAIGLGRWRWRRG